MDTKSPWQELLREFELAFADWLDTESNVTAYLGFVYPNLGYIPECIIQNIRHATESSPGTGQIVCYGEGMRRSLKVQVGIVYTGFSEGRERRRLLKLLDRAGATAFVQLRSDSPPKILPRGLWLLTLFEQLWDSPYVTHHNLFKTIDGVASASVECCKKLINSEQKQVNQDEHPSGAAQQLVRLDQMAAMVHRSKRTLETWLKAGTLPDPDIDGGGGKPSLWEWNNVREKLEKHSGIPQPPRFPSFRPVDRS